ncbi:MAG: RDD family protein [Elusimicrobia bacterium]|nr:RDD family protein [Elusimicrobiota bacterium]
MEPAAIETRAARFSDRFVAYLLDTLPFGAGAAATVWVLLGPLAKAPTPELLALVGAAWATAVFAYQLWGNVRGATLGKRLIGLRVVSRDGGGPPAFLSCLIRSAVWLVGSTAGSFGFLVALFNRENRTLHDYASGTVVVEAYRKSAAEGAALFLAGALCAVGLFVFQIYSGWSRPTPGDKAAVSKAAEGLEVIAQVQEAYKSKNGTYATSIEQLAEASGDPAEFRTAMAVLFRREPFQMEAGNRGWRIRAVALDRFRTPVVREGP